MVAIPYNIDQLEIAKRIHELGLGTYYLSEDVPRSAGEM
jgi:UDP:flavonoid glycosyltransferase YjiC (YdhE family)